MFLLEHSSGSRRALSLAIQCLILPDHVGVQQGLQACVPVAGSLGQDTENTGVSVNEHGESYKPRVIPVLATQRKCGDTRCSLSSTDRIDTFPILWESNKKTSQT